MAKSYRRRHRRSICFPVINLAATMSEGGGAAGAPPAAEAPAPAPSADQPPLAEAAPVSEASAPADADTNTAAAPTSDAPATEAAPAAAPAVPEPPVASTSDVAGAKMEDVSGSTEVAPPAAADPAPPAAAAAEPAAIAAVSSSSAASAAAAAAPTAPAPPSAAAATSAAAPAPVASSAAPQPKAFKPVTAAEAAAMAAAKAKARAEKIKNKKNKRSSKSPTGDGDEPSKKKKKVKKKKKKGDEFGPSGRRLPTAATRDPSAGPPGKKTKKPKASLTDTTAAPYSAAQAAVNEMMRKALEEDQYSALGSIVDTDSEDDEPLLPMGGPPGAGGPGGPGPAVPPYGAGTASATSKFALLVDPNSIPAPPVPAGAGGAGPRLSPVPMPSSAPGVGTTVRLDRNLLQAAMRKRLKIEEQLAARDVSDYLAAYSDDDEYDGEYDDGSASGPPSRGPSPTPSDAGGRKRRAGSRRGSRLGSDDSDDDGASGVDGDGAAQSAAAFRDGSGLDEDEMMDEFDDVSVFGQTGGSNATWVECDKCKKWRRLRGVVDAKKLPSKWYCHMNKTDPERAKCSAPEEEYETPATPESMQDQRTRKHLRLWVRRLQCNETYESRLPTMTTRGKKRSATTSAKEPYEWVRCCNPSCGKWRALLRFMDASTVMEQCKNGEWYCVLNTWDEKAASCAAPQENLPAIGCPPWVMQNEDVPP